LKVSHHKASVLSKISEWLKSTYEHLFDDGSGAMSISSRSKIHEYLGMTMDFSIPGEVKITMIPYIKEIMELFAQQDSSESTANTPAAEHLFKVNNQSTPPNQRQATIFHNFIAKCLFLTKQARPDISTAVAFLTTHVKGPNEDDWKKLVRMI
jgi:hypothetical protein